MPNLLIPNPTGRSPDKDQATIGKPVFGKEVVPKTSALLWLGATVGVGVTVGAMLPVKVTLTEPPVAEAVDDPPKAIWVWC